MAMLTPNFKHIFVHLSQQKPRESLALRHVLSVAAFFGSCAPATSFIKPSMTAQRINKRVEDGKSRLIPDRKCQSNVVSFLRFSFGMRLKPSAIIGTIR